MKVSVLERVDSIWKSEQGEKKLILLQKRDIICVR